MNQAGWFLLLLLFSTGLKAQVQLLQVPPNPAHFLLPEMWNVQVMNSQPEITVYAEATLSGKRQIAQARTAKFQLPQGATQLFSAPYTAGTIRVLQQEFASNQNQPLPVGEYQICVRVIAGETLAELASSCIDVVVEPLTPLMLFSPYDTEEIETPNPLLSWIPPGPAHLFPDINYQLKVAEVMKGQSTSEAIKKNNAMLLQADYSPINMVYPGFAEKLDTGKTYVWQVLGTTGNGQVLESEIWTFQLKKPDSLKKEIPPVYSYYKLKPEKDAYTGVAVKNLGFIFEEELPAASLDFKVLDEQQKEVPMDIAGLITHAGDNRFVLKLEEIGAFRSGAYYILEIKGRDFRKYYLPFRYFNNVNALGKKEK